MFRTRLAIVKVLVLCFSSRNPVKKHCFVWSLLPLFSLFCVYLISHQSSYFLSEVLNSISFAIIAVSYGIMYVAARDTHTAARAGVEIRGGGGDGSGGGMVQRMTIIVATDAACWCPIIVLGVASLCGISVPPKVSNCKQPSELVPGFSNASIILCFTCCRYVIL